MDFKDLVLKNRSYRRFDNSKPVGEETLKELVDIARNVPSGANMQPLRYALSWEPESNSKVFDSIGWAGYLPDWQGPEPNERPSAYIIVLFDKEVGGLDGTDSGIAAQTILLGAVERGFGGCMFGNIRKPKLKSELGVPDRYEILLVIALGVPVETVVLEELPTEGSVKYWRDENQVHHVPKRGLNDVLLETNL